MSLRPYYKRFPSDFIAGTIDLSAEEKGVYSCLLDLMYSRWAPVRDEPTELARLCGCSTRRFNQIKKKLAEFGKITITDGLISNQRFERECPVEKKEHEKAVENGAKGGDKAAENRAAAKENKDIEEKGIVPSHSPESIVQKEEESRGADAPPDGKVISLRPYAFEGRTIRLTKPDLERWRRSYYAIDDMNAALQAADDYYTEHPPDGGKWFFPVSRWLQREHAAALERKKQASYGVDAW